MQNYILFSIRISLLKLDFFFFFEIDFNCLVLLVFLLNFFGKETFTM